MADRKISDLTALTTPATGDLLPIVDISEAAAADKNKSITVGELLRGAPDGTAAAPGIAFESDGGNGMFLGGTDILAFSTGGSQAVTIDASQRVGIGTSSPSGLLTSQPSAGVTVAYNDNSGDALYISNANIAGGLGNFGGGITWGKPGGGGNQRTASIASVQTAGDADQCGLAVFTKASASNAGDLQESLRITHNGLVGIGTTSPGQPLEVATGTLNGGLLRLRNTNAASIQTFNISVDSNRDVNLVNGSGSTGLIFTSGTAERARIDSSGRLLVGTSSSPSAGDGQFGLLVVSGHTLGAACYASFQREEPATSITNDETIAWLNFGDQAGNSFANIKCIADADAGSGDYPGRLVFSTTADGASSPTERMRITSDAYVRLASGTGGIQFNGDTAAANALHDYEEGTFTPVLRGSTTAGTTANGAGTYVKVGNLVHFQISWENVTISGGSGTISIYEMPFTINAPNARHPVFSSMMHSVTFDSSKTQIWYGQHNENRIYGLQNGSGSAWTSWSYGDFDNGAIYLGLSGTYYTTA